ncbi:hypothetical protein JYU34_004106 [Plutella xylostella]|uniref:Uncharacterized protein n=1 Tax=Plutella xylostella TaxID=51655 RepID=A0ABQ7QX65_PLUXY|nr:hypothetical protein JYU34_004106 [Plutella xylostella]
MEKCCLIVFTILFVISHHPTFQTEEDYYKYLSKDSKNLKDDWTPTVENTEFRLKKMYRQFVTEGRFMEFLKHLFYIASDWVVGEFIKLQSLLSQLPLFMDTYKNKTLVK